MHGLLNEIELLTQLVDAACDFVAKHPDAATPELRSAVARVTSKNADRADRREALCKKCGAPIERRQHGWRHLDASSSRGCRAASFSAERGWNESLDKGWNASPTK